MSAIGNYLQLLWATPRPVNLALLPVPSGLRIWILAPHPDDFDSIGLTLHHFFQQQADLFLDVVSASSSGVKHGFCADDSPSTRAKQREWEQQESLRFFGLAPDHVRFLRLSEDEGGDPLENDEHESALEQRFQCISPHLVFLPHGNDTNLGHQRTFRMFSRIFHKGAHEIITFLIRDPKTLEFTTDAFFSFSEEQAHWKAALLRHHQSQQSRNIHQRGYGFDERILQVNRAIAKDLRLVHPYAEAYEFFPRI